MNRIWVFPIIAAIGSGIFLSVASHELNWSTTTTNVVGMALVSVVTFLGVPLVLLTDIRKPPAGGVQEPPPA